MTEVSVKNVRGEIVGSFDLDDTVFGIEPNRAVLHQAVVAQLANQRKGTHNTKTRGEVAGGTHKMWRQKGTGRARQGDKRAPHWTGGGVAFGPHPRSYHKAMPRKMRRLAMRSALSACLADEKLTIVDEITVPAARTKEMVGVLRALGLERGALIVLPDKDELVQRAAANLENVRTVTPGGLNLLDVLNFRHVVLTRSAAETITRLVLIGSGARARRGAAGIDSGSVEVVGAEQEVVRSTEAVGEPDLEMDDAALASPAPADVALADAAAEIAEPGDEPTVDEPKARREGKGA